jgi:hypothetical protein
LAFINRLQKKERAAKEKEEYLVRSATFITRAKIYCSGGIEVLPARPSVKHNLEGML